MSDPADSDPVSAAFSSKRIPHGSNKRGGKKSVFDPKQTFGVYKVECAAADGLRKGDDDGLLFEIHGLSDCGNALIASLSLGTSFQGLCVLAGSRKSLREVIEELEGDAQEHELSPSGSDVGEFFEYASSDRGANMNFDARERCKETFEKNSFRSPKFWMQWKGRRSERHRGAIAGQGGSLQPREDGKLDLIAANMGYLVFSKNNCKRFKGTLGCSALGWDNVEVAGFKVTSKATECSVAWAEFEANF